MTILPLNIILPFIKMVVVEGGIIPVCIAPRSKDVVRFVVTPDKLTALNGRANCAGIPLNTDAALRAAPEGTKVVVSNGVEDVKR